MLNKIKEFAKEVDTLKTNVINEYINSLENENRILSYWDNCFKDNPKKYIGDININRYVSYEDRKNIRKNRLCPEEIFNYSCGSFNRVMRWRGIPLYKNIYDFSLYPTILTEIQPKTIIELGTGDGASCIWYKDILKNHNLESKIITFDLHKPVKYFNDIEYEQFNLKNIDEIILNNCLHPWLVIEDCHHNLKNILKYFDKQMLSGDYLIVEDNSKQKQKIMDEFNNINNYNIDTRYSDFYGYNNCSFSDSILKKI